MSSKKNDSGLSLPWIKNSTNMRFYGKVLCFMDRRLHPISLAWHIKIGTRMMAFVPFAMMR